MEQWHGNGNGSGNNYSGGSGDNNGSGSGGNDDDDDDNGCSDCGNCSTTGQQGAVNELTEEGAGEGKGGHCHVVMDLMAEVED